MASIELVDASVDVPIFNSRGRSLKTTLIRRVGGQVETDGNDIVTVKALRRLNLSLRPGDRLGLVGHNGAGKSTLLRVLSHDVDSLRTYCTRAVLLEAGTIVDEGSVDEVWQRYIDGVERASEATIAEVHSYETDPDELDVEQPRMRNVLSGDAAR